MCHDAHLVQGGLPVKQDYVSVDQVALHCVTGTESFGPFTSERHANRRQVLVTAIAESDKRRSGMLVVPPHDFFPQRLNIVVINRFWERESSGNEFGNHHFKDLNIGIGGDDCSSSEIDALSTQIASESSFFSL